MASTNKDPRWRPGVAGGILTIGLLLAIALAVWSMQLGGRADRTTRVLVFGTTAKLTLTGADEAEAQGLQQAIDVDFKRLDALLHPWRPGSHLVAVNRALAAHETIDPEPELRRLLADIRPLIDSSGGRVDPAIGKLVGAYGYHAEPGDALARRDQRTIDRWQSRPPTIGDLIDSKQGWSTAHDSLELDFNAFAEGFAAQRAAARVAALPGVGGLLELGGDVVAFAGGPTRIWRIGLRDPWQPHALIGVIRITNGEGLFTSGSNALESTQAAVGVGRSGHLLDPRTGQPAKGAVLATALSRDPMRADAAASALLIDGGKSPSALLVSMAVDCAIILLDDGTAVVSRGFADRIEWLRPSATIRVIPASADCASVAMATPRGGLAQ